MIVLCDPRTFPAGALVAELNESRPAMPVLGGLASAAAPGGGCLLHGREEVIAGAVAVSFSGVPVVPCVSQGAEPIGPEMAVTACEGNVITELASRPAIERLREVIEELDERERRLAVAGLLLGIVIDENQPEHERGDFLVRPIIGADESEGRSPSATTSASGRRSVSTSATPARPTRTCASRFASRPRRCTTTAPRGRCCSPATAAASGCSASPTTTRRRSPTRSERRAPASSAQARSVRSAAGTSSTGSRPRSRSSRGHEPRARRPRRDARSPRTSAPATSPRRRRSRRRARRGDDRPQGAGVVFGLDVAAEVFARTGAGASSGSPPRAGGRTTSRRGRPGRGARRRRCWPASARRSTSSATSPASRR